MANDNAIMQWSRVPIAALKNVVCIRIILSTKRKWKTENIDIFN